MAAIVKVAQFEKMLTQGVLRILGGQILQPTDLDSLLGCLNEAERIQVLHVVLRDYLQELQHKISEQASDPQTQRRLWRKIHSRCEDFVSSAPRWVRYPPSLLEIGPYTDRQGLFLAFHLGILAITQKEPSDSK